MHRDFSSKTVSIFHLVSYFYSYILISCKNSIGSHWLTSLLNENLFRLIFETQIHIQIRIRYFKSLPIATCYLSAIQVRYLYLHSKTYNMDLKWNLYLTSLSHRGPVNSLTPTFGNINLIDTTTNLILVLKFNQKRWHESLIAP